MTDEATRRLARNLREVWPDIDQVYDEIVSIRIAGVLQAHPAYTLAYGQKVSWEGHAGSYLYVAQVPERPDTSIVYGWASHEAKTSDLSPWDDKETP